MKRILIRVRDNQNANKLIAAVLASEKELHSSITVQKGSISLTLQYEEVLPRRVTNVLGKCVIHAVEAVEGSEDKNESSRRVSASNLKNPEKSEQSTNAGELPVDVGVTKTEEMPMIVRSEEEENLPIKQNKSGDEADENLSRSTQEDGEVNPPDNQGDCANQVKNDGTKKVTSRRRKKEDASQTDKSKKTDKHARPKAMESQAFKNALANSKSLESDIEIISKISGMGNFEGTFKLIVESLIEKSSDINLERLSINAIKGVGIDLSAYAQKMISYAISKAFDMRITSVFKAIVKRELQRREAGSDTTSTEQAIEVFLREQNIEPEDRQKKEILIETCEKVVKIGSIEDYKKAFSGGNPIEQAKEELKISQIINSGESKIPMKEFFEKLLEKVK